MLDVEKFVKGMHDYLEKQLSPVIHRIKALELRQPEKGDKGDAGERGTDGKSIDEVDLQKLFEKNIAVWALDFERRASDLLQKAIDKIPVPKDGKDGAPGAAGKDGANGIDGKDGAPGAAGKDGANGIDGKDGAPGERGEIGQRGEKGESGKDGKDISEADLQKCFDRYAALWALDFERRAADVLQKSIDKIKQPENGKDGHDGTDGKDGFGFDDLSIVQLTDKRLKFVFESGDRKKEFVIDMPIVIDCGVFGEGKEYKKGDGVTYGGSFWIAQKDNPNQKPGSGSEWRLAVKCGKDGKDTY
jgi:integrin beta 3